VAGRRLVGQVAAYLLVVPFGCLDGADAEPGDHGEQHEPGEQDQTDPFEGRHLGTGKFSTVQMFPLGRCNLCIGRP